MRQQLDFAEWLEEEITKRAWRPADLARASGLYQSTVWKVLNRERLAGPEVCQALARALKLPAEVVYRKAGLLPELPAPVQDEQLTTLYDYYKRLSHKAREDAVEYMIFKYKQEQDQ